MSDRFRPTLPIAILFLARFTLIVLFLFEVKSSAQDASTYYQLVSRNTGKVLEVSSSGVADQLGNNGGTNQQWQILPTDGGFYTITNRATGEVLDVYGQSTDNGAVVQQYPSNGGFNQQWQFVPTDSGYVEIVNRNSGKVLDVKDVSTTDGATVQQWAYGGGLNQQWLLSAVGSVSGTGSTTGGSGASGPPPPSSFAKEFIYLNNRVIAVENKTFTASPGLPNPPPPTPPSVVIENPAPNASVNAGSVTFSGYVLDSSNTVSQITASIPGLRTQTATMVSRPDICSAHSGIQGCPNVGWTVTFNTAGLSQGSTNTLTVTANDGHLSGVATLPFSIVPVCNGSYQEALTSLGEAAMFASPNPMQANSSGYGTTTLQYNNSPSNENEVRVGSPDGPLLTSGTASAGSGATGAWVTNGMLFFLQDVSNNMPLTINHTMAIVSANVQSNGVSLTADHNPVIISDGSGLGILTLSYSAPGVANTTVTVGPNYAKFCAGGTSGTCQPTGKWVSNGMQFFLHNTPNTATPTAANVIASFTANVIDLGAPGFVLSSLPRVVSVGARPSFPTLELDSENGFSGTVALSATGIPPGASVAFSQTSLVPCTQITITVTAPLSTPWSYVTLTGQSGTLQHNDVLEIQNLPPQITGYNTGSYGGGNATITVNATDPEADLSYVQINIAGSDNQGLCAATVSLTAGPSLLPNATANGACSVVSTTPASGNGSSGAFSITFHFDSTRFYGPKNVTGFVVEQSGVNTSEPMGTITIPQNQ